MRGKFAAQNMSLFDPVPPAEVKKSQLCTRPALVRGHDGKKKVLKSIHYLFIWIHKYIFWIHTVVIS